MPRNRFAADPRLASYAAAGPSERAAIRRATRDGAAAGRRFNLAKLAALFRAGFPDHDAAMRAIGRTLEQADRWVADSDDAHQAARAYRGRVQRVRTMIARGA